MSTRRQFLMTAAAAPAAARPAVSLHHTSGEKVTISANGRTLCEYRYSAARPKPYIHPLCLADGTPVTRDAPADHVHHRGLMVAWSEVNGFDFWGEVNPAPHGQIHHRRFDRLADGPAAEIVAVNDWVAGGRTLLTECRTLRVPAPTAEGVFLDWTTELEPASGPVLLAAGAHTYNGLGVRVVESMDGGDVLNARGARTIPEANGQNAPWCAYSGAGLGIALFDHPANPRHPNAFFVMNRAFGYLSAAPTFHAPVELKPGAPLRLRWGALTFRGTPEIAALNRHFTQWSQS